MTGLTFVCDVIWVPAAQRSHVNDFQGNGVRPFLVDRLTNSSAAVSVGKRVPFTVGHAHTGHL